MSENLDKLAAEIREEAGKVAAAFRTSLDHARSVGVLLNRAFTAIKEAGKQWHRWVVTNCKFGAKTAANYRNIADRWDEIQAHPKFGGELTITEALKILVVGGAKSQWNGKQEGGTQVAGKDEKAAGTDAGKDEKDAEKDAGKTSGADTSKVADAVGAPAPSDGWVNFRIKPKAGTTVDTILMILRTLGEAEVA